MAGAFAVRPGSKVVIENRLRRYEQTHRSVDMLGAMRYLLEAWPERAQENKDMSKAILREEYRTHTRTNSWGTPVEPKTTAHLGKLTPMEARAVTRVVKTLLAYNILMQHDTAPVSFKQAKERLKEINLRPFGIQAKVVEKSGGKPTLDLRAL